MSDRGVLLVDVFASFLSRYAVMYRNDYFKHFVRQFNTVMILVMMIMIETIIMAMIVTYNNDNDNNNEN